MGIVLILLVILIPLVLICLYKIHDQQIESNDNLEQTKFNSFYVADDGTIIREKALSINKTQPTKLDQAKE